MAYCRSAAIVVLLLAWIAVPTLRCALPAELTPQERACCKKMDGQCGQMPSQHECCRRTVASPQNAMASPRAAAPLLDAAVGVVHSPSVSLVAAAPSAAPAVYGPSPPLLLGSTVLRI